METHTCKTYLALYYDFDRDLNAKLIKEKGEYQPEEIGITTKVEVENYLKDNFNCHITWKLHHFVLELNSNYEVYVSDMIRITLKPFINKIDKLLKLKTKYNLTSCLVIVPTIVKGSDEPYQCLSLDDDIVEFLYKSKTKLDLDYYII